MRRLATIILVQAIFTLVILGAILPVLPALAQYYYPPPGYGYDRPYYDRPYGTYNGCPPGFTVQGGACRPYQGAVGSGYRTYNGCPRGFTIQDGVCKPYRGY
jgi:hypothetical protein